MQMLLQRSPLTLSEDVPDAFLQSPPPLMCFIEDVIWGAITTLMQLDDAELDDREAQFQAMRQHPEALTSWHDRVPFQSNPHGKYSRHYELSPQNLSAAQIDQIAFWLWERDHGQGLLPAEDSEADYIDGMIVLQWLMQGWMEQEACPQ